MADDVAAAMILTMDDDELAGHVADLRALLDSVPQGHPEREHLLPAFGRACSAYNARGLSPYPYEAAGE